MVPSGYDLGCNPTTIPDDSVVSSNVTATGNCGSVTTFKVTHIDSLVNCAASRVFTVTAVDACGNTATAYATYTWTANTTAPTIVVPSGYDLGCNPTTIPDDSVVSSNVTATGNCGSVTTFKVTHIDSLVNCAASRVFTVTAVDACGNTATAYATYTWTANTTAPTIVVPAGYDLGCNPTPIPDDSVVSSNVTATGNCGSVTTFKVTHIDSLVNCAASRVFTVTAVDACGNTATAYATYTWTANTTAPTIVVPAGYDLGCNPTTIPDDSVVSNNVTATGNCGSVTTFKVTHIDSLVNCAASRMFTVTAVDACGNTATAYATYTWTANTTAPTIVVPAGYDLGCNPTPIPDDSVVSSNVTATGNCGSVTTFKVTHIDSLVNCAASRVFTVTAVDACGNTATAYATYTWTANTTAPTLVGVPASTNLGCNPAVLPDLRQHQSVGQRHRQLRQRHDRYHHDQRRRHQRLPRDPHILDQGR